MTTLTIYHGATKPIKAIGHNQCHLLAFAEKYRGWHSFATDRATIRAIEGLKAKGCIQTNDHGQFQFVYPREA